MKVSKVLLIGLLVSHISTFSTVVWGSTGGVLSGGGLSAGAEHFTGFREWVELERQGGLLRGSPPHDLLKLITIYAPGIKNSHIIFREIRTIDGRRSFLLTAPEDLQAKIQRITLFLQTKSDFLELYQQVEGVWKKHHPQSLQIDGLEGRDGPSQDLLAFSVEKPGFFWVAETPTVQLSQASFVPQNPSARSLMGGSILWGVSVWAASLLLLSIGWLISRRLYSMSKLAGK